MRQKAHLINFMGLLKQPRYCRKLGSSSGAVIYSIQIGQNFRNTDAGAFGMSILESPFRKLYQFCSYV